MVATIVAGNFKKKRGNLLKFMMLLYYMAIVSVETIVAPFSLQTLIQGMPCYTQE